MKLYLSRASEAYPQKHVVLTLAAKEAANIGEVIYEILGPKIRPVREGNLFGNKIKYRFHMKHLDTIMLALPQAEKSAGLQTRLDRLTPRELIDKDVPELDIPGFWDRKNDTPGKLFNYQAIAIKWVVDYLSGAVTFEDENVHSFLENDEMGLGKTVIALASIAILGTAPVLVVTPKNGKFVWERENARWTDLDMVIIDADTQTLAQREALLLEDHAIYVINPEMLRGGHLWMKTGEDDQGFPITDQVWEGKHPALFERQWSLVVFDEYHRFGSPDSQQTKGMLELKSDLWLPMSGTPYMTRPTQLWPILHRCWPERYLDPESFRDSLVIESSTDKKTVGYKPRQMKELKLFIQDRSIRRRQDQVLKDLPGVFSIDVPVELNREQRRLYNKIKREMLLLLEDGTEKHILQIRTQIMRLKQACFSPELYGGSKHSTKIDELLPVIRSMVDSGEKAIVYSEWAKATRILQRELAEFNPAYVDGSVKGRARMEQGDMFNTDEDCHLYIGTIGANKEAISLGAATRVIFTDLDYSHTANDQAIKRSAAGGLRGIGSGVKKVSVYELFAVDTYEDRVRGMVAERRAIFNSLIERDGGRPSSRKLIENIRELI